MVQQLGSPFPIDQSTIADRAFWLASDLWPKTDRGHVFIGTALREVGAAMHGDKWKGTEPSLVGGFDPIGVNRLLRSPATDPSVIASLTAWGTDVDRALAAAEWLADAGRNGDVVAVGRMVEGGGKLFSLEPDIWNVEPVWHHRFVWGTCPHVAGGQQRAAYVFVTRESLDAAIRHLPFAADRAISVPTSAEDAWLSPFMEVLIEVAREEKIGPTPDETPDATYLADRIAEVAARRGIAENFTPNLRRSAATLLRHPNAKKGLRVWRSELPKGSTLKS